MGLCSKVVNLIRMHLLNDSDQAARVGQITMAQDESPVFLVRILVKVIYAICIE